MRTNVLPLLLSLVALAVGAAGLFAGMSSRTSRNSIDPEPQHRPRQAAPDQDLRKSIASLREEVATLREQVQKIRALARATPKQKPEPATPAKQPVPKKVSKAKLEELMNAVLTGKAGPKETAEFWRLARTSFWIDTLLARLEKTVKSSPTDVDARMNLARAYVAKLYTVPNGPERGAWATRAEKQWRAVLQQDSRNEEARLSLAISLSSWPDFFGKMPEAIHQLETLKKQQEGESPESGQTHTWLLLSQLYLKQGRHADAVATLKDGLSRFPDNHALKAALDAAGH